MAITRRALQYKFFCATPLERLKAIMDLSLLTKEVADSIPIGVWSAIMDTMEDCEQCRRLLADKMGFKEEEKK